MTKLIRYLGIDQNGIARVYGEARREHEAWQEAKDAIIEYVGRRPDTGPVSEWLIERE